MLGHVIGLNALTPSHPHLHSVMGREEAPDTGGMVVWWIVGSAFGLLAVLIGGICCFKSRLGRVWRRKRARRQRAVNVARELRRRNEAHQVSPTNQRRREAYRRSESTELAEQYERGDDANGNTHGIEMMPGGTLRDGPRRDNRHVQDWLNTSEIGPSSVSTEYQSLRFDVGGDLEDQRGSRDD